MSRTEKFRFFCFFLICREVNVENACDTCVLRSMCLSLALTFKPFLINQAEEKQKKSEAF